MNLFRVMNLKTGENTVVQAFNLNAARRQVKKMMGIPVKQRLPKAKKLWIDQMSQAEIEQMFQAMQPPLAEANSQDNVPLVDPLNGFQVIEEAAAKVEKIEAQVTEIRAEVQSVVEDIKNA